MEFHVLIPHGIPWGYFTRVYSLKQAKIQILLSVFRCPPRKCPGTHSICPLHKRPHGVHSVWDRLYVCWWYDHLLYREEYWWSRRCTKSIPNWAICVVCEKQADPAPEKIWIHANPQRILYRPPPTHIPWRQHLRMGHTQSTPGCGHRR